jgi:hypothetical protein
VSTLPARGQTSPGLIIAHILSSPALSLGFGRRPYPCLTANP